MAAETTQQDVQAETGPAHPEAAALEARRRLAAEAARGRVAEAELTLAFLSGNQWMQFSWADGGLREVENETDDIRVTDNRMLPAFRRWLYYLFKENPVITCFEGGWEQVDAESAAVASALCDYWESNNGWREARQRQVAWMGVAGVGYVAVEWAKTGRTAKRRRTEYVEEGTQDAKGRTVHHRQVEEEVPEGDLAFRVLSPLATYLFPLDATDWSRVEEVMHCEIVTLGWIRSEFPDLDTSKLRPLGDADLHRGAQAAVDRWIAPEFGMGATALPQEKRYLAIRSWQRSSAGRPQGRYLVAVGGLLAYDGELPYCTEAREVDPTDALNLTMGVVPCFAMNFPGRMIPPGPIGLMRSAQIRLNDLLTDQARNRKAVGRNKLLYEEGTVADDQWTGDHAERIPLPPGTRWEPKYVQAPPLAGIDGEIARAEFALEEATGMTAVLRGHNPTQARAAFQLEILREESMTLTSADAKQHEKSFEATARLALAIARRHYSAERIISIVGRDRQGMALTFKTARIVTDIRVKTGSMIPRNHALREAKLMELLQYGAFMDAAGRPNMRLFWEMSEMGTMNRSLEPEQRQRNRAKEEGVRMLVRGEVVGVFEHEDHAVHVEVHVADMARPEWYEADDDTKALMLAHVEEHRAQWAGEVAPESEIPPDPVAGLGGTAAAEPGMPPGAGTDGRAPRLPPETVPAVPAPASEMAMAAAR